MKIIEIVEICPLISTDLAHFQFLLTLCIPTSVGSTLALMK